MATLNSDANVYFKLSTVLAILLYDHLQSCELMQFNNSSKNKLTL